MGVRWFFLNRLNPVFCFRSLGVPWPLFNRVNPVPCSSSFLVPWSCLNRVNPVTCSSSFPVPLECVGLYSTCQIQFHVLVPAQFLGSSLPVLNRLNSVVSVPWTSLAFSQQGGSHSCSSSLGVPWSVLNMVLVLGSSLASLL